MAAFAFTGRTSIRLQRLRIASARDMAVAEGVTLTPTTEAASVSPGPIGAMLHPGAAHAPLPATYVVRDGDTLSLIATRVFGHATMWPALWWANRSHVHNPAALEVGTTLNLSLPAHPHKVWLLKAALAAIPQPVVQRRAAPPATVTGQGTPVPVTVAAPVSGIYSYSALESLWVSAGGPSWAEAAAANVAICESGGNPDAYNPSGATGLWQILGAVVAGDLTDPMVNAENAVSKFHASGDTWAQWVCTP
jgi:hypothetical protein